MNFIALGKNAIYWQSAAVIFFCQGQFMYLMQVIYRLILVLMQSYAVDKSRCDAYTWDDSI